MQADPGGYPVCQALRASRPKPATFPERMRDSQVRTQLRAGDIAGWGWDRLVSAAAAIDHEVVVTLRPRVRAEA